VVIEIKFIGDSFRTETFILDIRRLNSTLLWTFLVVAEAGQLSKAARRLHLCQPAVTGQIRRLESGLDTTLFIRSAHGVSLTPRGARLREQLKDVFAARISDPKLRRAMEGVKCPRDLEALPLIWRESGAGTRAVLESVFKDCGVNVRKLDQQFGVGSTDAVKSLVIAGLGVGFLSFWDIQQELGMGLVQKMNIPGLRIQRMFFLGSSKR
jgi:DNA-binding transcriptional LysR family regulator